MPRENSKCRKWEKERRDRLKDGFTNLAKTLPCFDPSLTICKIDILQKAANSIQELQDRVKHLLSSDTEKKSEKELIIKKLQDRVKKLLLRNEQLSNLLRDAGITVPSVCGTIKKFKKQPLWSKRITLEQAELRKTEMEKENIASVEPGKTERNKSKTLENISKFEPKLSGRQRRGRITGNKRKRGTSISNCYIVLPQSLSFRSNLAQQYYLITNQPTTNIRTPVQLEGPISKRNSKTEVAKTKSKSLKTIINPTSLSSLGPGTLILGNGLTLPILPQQHTLLSNSSNIVLNSTFCTVSKVVQKQEVSCSDKKSLSKQSQSIIGSSTKTLPFIKPKYCLTRTTQVNKVPIPALTSPYASNCCLFNDIKINSNKKDVKAKKPIKTTVQSKTDAKEANKRKTKEVKSSNKKIKTDLEKNLSDDKNCNINPVSSSDQIASDSVNVEDRVKTNTANTSEICSTGEQNVEKIVEQEACNLDKTSEITGLKNIEDKEATSLEMPCERRDQEVRNEKDSEKSNSEMSTVTTSVTTTTNDEMKTLDMNLPHSELSNDIFASLQVPSGCQNPESTSPTAAFLLAFPLVSSGVKVTEVIDGENSESQSVTPTLLQIGTMDTTKPSQSQSDAISSNFLNLDSFSFFSKEICGSFDNSYTTADNNKTEAQSTGSVKSNNINTSIYANVKSPCLPTCAAEPVAKQKTDIFAKKSAETSKVVSKNVKTCDNTNTNTKFNENNVYNSQVQQNTKLDLNFSLPKFGDVPQKLAEQKSLYNTTTTYPNSNCDFNYRSDLVRTCANTTCSYTSVNKNYANPLYTNCNNYNYNYYPETNFNQNYYKNIPRNESKTYYPLNYDSYLDCRKNDTTAYTGKYDASVYTKEKKFSNSSRPKPVVENKQPVNWMTTPDNRLQASECLLTPFSKANFSQPYPFTSYVTSTSTYFSTPSMESNNMNCSLETKKSLDLPIMSLNSHQRMENEEKQFSWSPTKLPHFLDTPHTFVNSTLPTLVGDLALGNTLPFAEQKNDYKPQKENKDYRQINKVNSYDNQTNFLSVSQLVDHSKPENVPAKPSSRRNSGNRSKSNIQQKTKRLNKHDNKDMLPHCAVNNENLHQSRSNVNYNTFSGIDVFTEQKSKILQKNVSSSYSAEALIGNQVSDDANKRYPPAVNKSIGNSSFLAENIIYIPPVDLPQENYMSQNQNYQGNNFTHNLTTSFQNNTYASNSFIYTASTIASSYLGTNNFDASSYDYLSDTINLMSNPASKDPKHYMNKNCSKQLNKEEKNNSHSSCSNNMKKIKKKTNNDTTNALFDFPFLSVPGSNNSPILPDDFHSHTNFLTPAAPFTCKNSLYPKQNNDISGSSLLPLSTVGKSSIQHPEISPSINAVGTSLTNFNLCTIFPEINKGPISDMYQDARIKEHLHHKNYSSTTPQVPFSEPKFNFNS